MRDVPLATLEKCVEKVTKMALVILGYSMYSTPDQECGGDSYSALGLSDYVLPFQSAPKGFGVRSV